MAAALAAVAVLVGFVALGQFLPGGDELPYLMLAQNLLNTRSHITPVTPDAPPLLGVPTPETSRLVARAPRARLHSARPSRSAAPGIPGREVLGAHPTHGTAAVTGREPAGVATRIRWLLGESARASWLDNRAATSQTIRAATSLSLDLSLSVQLDLYGISSPGVSPRARSGWAGRLMPPEPRTQV